MPSQGCFWSLFRKRLYTDFFAGAQLLFVLVEGLVDMHACVFVETQGTGQVLGIHTQSNFAVAASIELVERMTQEGKPKTTFAPRTAHT